MNHQTIATAQKAIHYYQSEVGSGRVTGGSLPDDAGLVVAVRPASAPSATSPRVEHSNNGNGPTPAHSAPRDGTQAPLQALLLIADEGVDTFPLIAAVSEGTTIGPAGDSVGPDTQRTLISWDANYTDRDGSLTESYVISVAATLLPQHSAPAREEAGLGPESAAGEQDYAVATDESDTPGTNGIISPTGQEAGERADAEESPEHEAPSRQAPSRQAPSANEETAGERIVLPAHTVSVAGAEDDTAETGPAPASEADTAELQTALAPEDDDESRHATAASGAVSDSRAGSTAAEAPDEDVLAATDTPEAGAPETDPQAATDPGHHEEPHAYPEPSETTGTLARDGGEEDGIPQSEAEAPSHNQEQPTQRFYYDEEREDGASRTSSNAHTSHSQHTSTHEADASEEAEEADRHWIHTLTQGRTSTPEQRAYVAKIRNSSQLAAKLRIKRPPEPPPRLAHIDTLPEPAIERVATSPEGPGIVMPMIRKGGTGKTTMAVELAFMLARLFGDDGADAPSRTGRVLVADMNLTNPDLPERLHVSGNGRAGVKDLLAGEHISRVVNRTALANLDALFLLGRGDEDISPLMRDLSDEETMRAVIGTLVRDGGYDVIVVDSANTLPAEAENPASFVMTMWASIADARYLILQPEKAAFKNAGSFVRRLGSALGEGKPMVPVLNSFPTQKVYEEAPVTPDMANRRRAAIAAVEYFQNSDAYPVVPAINARGKTLASPLIVPDYPEEVRGFATEGRALSMYSQIFANAYRSIALDAVRRILDNRNPQERC